MPKATLNILKRKGFTLPAPLVVNLYAIQRETKIDAAILSRFLRNKAGTSIKRLEQISVALGISIDRLLYLRRNELIQMARGHKSGGSNKPE